MDERIVAVVAALLVCVGALSPAVAADSDSPTVDVTVDAAPLDLGETHHTPTDPLVRVAVSADSPVSLVEIRVDGTTRHAFEPGSERFDRSVTLDLETGPHRITVVARADGVATHESTVIKDDEAPVVDYTTPFGSNASTADDDTTPTELTVNRGNVSVGGDLRDLSAVEAVRINHTYQYELANGTERTGTAQHLLPTPGADFRQSLALVPGSNRITVFTEDAVGNVRDHEFTIAVDDERAPALSITDVEWLSPTRLHIEGRATDRVQVQSVWLEGNDTAVLRSNATNTDANPTRHPIVFPASTAPNPDRRNVTIDTTVYHPAGTDHLVLGTNDTAGNERTWNYSLSTFLAPNVTVDDGRTGYVDDRAVAVGGRVVDGQVRTVSVEAVDPETGRIVDIRPVELGDQVAFDTRLDAASDETQVRVRVRDASGAEHLTNATVAGALDPTATPTRGTSGGDDGGSERVEASNTSDADAGEPAENESSGVRLPLVGVVVPTPNLGVLSANVSLPVPFVGPFEVPLLAVGVPVVAVVAAVAARRRGG
ncbi:hypothetical protein DU500_06160 [Haloplanus rubicundus]|uniref:Uncharacterized protein n=1 Tax=Haloplanus rubicundus TaxID=1547898 RepID=A0A345E1I7_9EURY|nr:hypothetical protein [Haloplanus rubicundus]AXG06059.1 hypothetical protein DU500_06160 [Haloplanus rubicundus]